MSDTLQKILEKYKKVEKGPLDPKRSGADGKEDDFIGKHTDNVDVKDAPGKVEHDKIEGAAKKIKRKPFKGYEPGEDEDMYESVDHVSLDEVDMTEEEFELMIEEDATFYLKMIDEAVQEFIDEEATEEEKELLDEMLSSDEGYEEFIDILFEGKKGVADENKEGGDDVIDPNPKLKGKKAQGDGKGGAKEDQMVKEDIERHADVKLIKTKTPEGKVVWRKKRAETEVSKRSD